MGAKQVRCVVPYKAIFPPTAGKLTHESVWWGQPGLFRRGTLWHLNGNNFHPPITSSAGVITMMPQRVITEGESTFGLLKENVHHPKTPSVSRKLWVAKFCEKSCHQAVPPLPHFLYLRLHCPVTCFLSAICISPFPSRERLSITSPHFYQSCTCGETMSFPPCFNFWTYIQDQQVSFLPSSGFKHDKDIYKRFCLPMTFFLLQLWAKLLF